MGCNNPSSDNTHSMKFCPCLLSQLLSLKKLPQSLINHLGEYYLSLAVSASILAECFAFFNGIRNGMEGSVQFWIGDWLNYGRKAYERGKYEKALEKLEYEPRTLRVYAYVANQVNSLIRNNNLTFNHHRTVAPLPPREQKD
jgi:hypothetical protein